MEGGVESLENSQALSAFSLFLEKQTLGLCFWSCWKEEIGFEGRNVLK